MTQAQQYGIGLLAASLALVVGCDWSPLSNRRVEYPFQHPAADKVGKIFQTLGVYSEADYRKLPRRDRYVWDVQWFETEVMNGGIDQYFFNSAGDHADECLEALQAIGAKQSYRLLRQACDLFPDQHPDPDRDVRQKQLREVAGPKHLDELIQGEIEVDLYQHLLDYYSKADPKAM